MNKNFEGILLVWSRSVGAGKTIALTQWAMDPKKILFFTNDSKRLPFKEKDLGGYYNVMSQGFDVSHNPSKRYQIGEWFINIINKVEPNQYDAVIVDTFYDIGEYICAVVDNNPERFRENFSQMSKYKWPQIKGQGHLLVRLVLNMMADKFKFVGLSAYSMSIRDSNNLDTGLVMPRVRQEVMEAASSIWLLTLLPGHRVPSFLVTKQGAKAGFVKDKGLQVQMILPEKVTPHKDDTSVWDAYERYYQNPISTRELLPEEIPTEDEYSSIKGTFTPDQLVAYKIAQRTKLMEFEGKERDIKKRVREIYKNQLQTGVDFGAIMKVISEELGEDLEIPQIIKMTTEG